MKKLKTKSKKSKILTEFKNKFVAITMKNMRSNRNNNMQFAGYLLDEDKEYFYLGETAKGPIQAAIPKSENGGISLADEIELLMEQIEVPEDNGVQ